MLLSTALLHHSDEPFLRRWPPACRTVDEEPNPFSSIWLERTA